MKRRFEIQNEASEAFINKGKRGILNIAQRVGKTKISIDILKRLFNYSPCILICYPDNKIKQSWIDDFIKWGYNQTENVTYCNYTSLSKYSSKIFDIVIFDEIHTLSEKEKELAKELCENNMVILGLSGTISKDTETELLTMDLPIVYRYTMDNAVEDNIISDYQITVHLVELDTTVKTKNKKGKLLTEKQKYDNYSYVISQMKRDGRNFMHLALSRNRLSLSSIGKKEYTKKLLSDLKDKRIVIFTGLADVADSLGIPSYHYKMDDWNFQYFQNGTINQLALAAMGKAGVTYPNLDAVILYNFTYNKEETSQILSRAMNLDYNGKIADLHIICLNEPPEIKKVQESLSMLDKNKIKYI